MSTYTVSVPASLSKTLAALVGSRALRSSDDAAEVALSVGIKLAISGEASVRDVTAAKAEMRSTDKRGLISIPQRLQEGIAIASSAVEIPSDFHAVTMLIALGAIAITCKRVDGAYILSATTNETLSTRPPTSIKRGSRTLCSTEPKTKAPYVCIPTQYVHLCRCSGPGCRELVEILDRDFKNNKRAVCQSHSTAVVSLPAQAVTAA